MTAVFMPRQSGRVVKAGAAVVAPVAVAAGAVVAEEPDTAIADAYSAGVEAGRTAALAEAAASSAAADAVARAVVAALDEHSATSRVDTDELLATAVEIARWIVGRDLRADSSSLLERLGDATSRMVGSIDLVIAVAPRDMDLVLSWAGTRAQVVADPSLQPGEARITTATSEACITIAEAVRRAQDALGLLDTDVASDPALS